MSAAFYAVDRFEGKLAILVADDGSTLEVQRSALPPRVKEGSVLRIQTSTTGTIDWPTAQIDVAEEARRRGEAQARLDRMKRSDPGGDITL